jgi:membrane protease YdiL (CAAX protease family)
MIISRRLYKYLYDKRGHPALQFLKFILIAFTAILVGNLISMLIIIALYGLGPLFEIMRLNLSGPYTIHALWIMQILGTTIPLGAAPVYYAYVSVKKPREYLKPTVQIPWILFVIVFCTMIISSPLIEFLSNINQQMVLPHFLSSLQKWMRDSEDQAQKLTEVLLQMKTFWNMFIKILIIGLLTAIVEEFMFRGCVQTIFIRWTKNTHIAIWITAILFSAFHMEFFGFLPRLMLGVLFGYFVAWSGSIWTSVWAHFINNATAVTVTYLFQHKIIATNPDDQHIFNYNGYLFSLIIILFLLYLYRNIALTKKTIPEH